MPRFCFVGIIAVGAHVAGIALLGAAAGAPVPRGGRMATPANTRVLIVGHAPELRIDFDAIEAFVATIPQEEEGG